MLTDDNFYYKKFDTILLMSPSASKMGIPLKKEFMTTEFSMSWIADQLMTINLKQVKLIKARLRELGLIERFEN